MAILFLFISLFVYEVLSINSTVPITNSSTTLSPPPTVIVDSCNVFSNCTLCLYNDFPCGWCGSTGTCMTGDINGPTLGEVCPGKTNTGGPVVTSANAWEFTYSYIVSQSDVNGDLLSPGLVTVFLRPGIPVVVPVQLSIPLIPPIDFFFLLDASISMQPYISLIRTLLPQINTSLSEIVAEARLALGDSTPATVTFGMGSYIEKPISPFACYPEAFVLRVLAPLSTNYSYTQDALDHLLDRLSINYEHPENPLEACLLAAWDNSGNYTLRIGWRPSAFRIIMMCTDASAHVQGQGKTVGIFKPNNHDGIPDGDPPGTGEDYVDPVKLKAVLIQQNINPLFGAIATSGVLPFYANFSTYLGIGSWVGITNNSQEVVEAILSGTQAVLNKTILATQSDTLDRIASIYPPAIYAAAPLSTVTFNITVLAPLTDTENFGVTGDSVVRYVGFSDTVTITSITAVQCVGCSLNNPDYQLDQCKVCGGNNTACLGCDGQLNSGLTNDICGVCGGTGQTCKDCRGVSVAPGGNAAQYDLCGVCNGTNSTCLGCDGVPNSGLVWSSCSPPVCGGAPCSALTAAVAVLASIAVVGLVFAIVALVLLFSAGAAMATADAELIEKEANLHDNPLYEEAKKKFDNPLYGGDT